MFDLNKDRAVYPQLELARYLIIVVVMLGFSGCSFLPVVDTRVAEKVTEPQPVIKKVEVIEAQPHPDAKKPGGKHTPFAILLSEDNDSFQQVADEIVKQAGVDVELFYLESSAQQQLSELDLLQRSKFKKVIVIGSTAANRAKVLTAKQVVFTQVFNYQQEGLLEAGFTGVSMIPSADALFAEWKALSPTLERVAVITGFGHRDQLVPTIEAASKYGVKIEHREVNNDKEFLYLSKQLMPSVQGFWLLPDNRVLSRRAIKAFLSQTSRQDKQVALFHSQLMQFGGSIYVGFEATDVARQALQQLNNPAQQIRYLQKAEISINRQFK